MNSPFKTEHDEPGQADGPRGEEGGGRPHQHPRPVHRRHPPGTQSCAHAAFIRDLVKIKEDAFEHD